MIALCVVKNPPQVHVVMMRHDDRGDRLTATAAIDHKHFLPTQIKVATERGRGLRGGGILSGFLTFVTD
jgi:hypothetical protein